MEKGAIVIPTLQAGVTHPAVPGVREAFPGQAWMLRRREHVHLVTVVSLFKALLLNEPMVLNHTCVSQLLGDL